MALGETKTRVSTRHGSLVELLDYGRHVIPCIKTSATSILESDLHPNLGQSDLDVITFGVLRSPSPQASISRLVSFCFHALSPATYSF